VVGRAWVNDPKSSNSGSVATGRAFHARQVEGDDPDKKGYPGTPGWGLGVGLAHPIKMSCSEAFRVGKNYNFEIG
jgi:hypothetical protein